MKHKNYAVCLTNTWSCLIIINNNTSFMVKCIFECFNVIIHLKDLIDITESRLHVCLKWDQKLLINYAALLYTLCYKSSSDWFIKLFYAVLGETSETKAVEAELHQTMKEQPLSNNIFPLGFIFKFHVWSAECILYDGHWPTAYSVFLAFMQTFILWSLVSMKDGLIHQDKGSIIQT